MKTFCVILIVYENIAASNAAKLMTDRSTSRCDSGQSSD